MNMGLGELMSQELEIEVEEAELLDAEILDAEGEEDPAFDPGPAQGPLELNPVLRPRNPVLNPILQPRKEVCSLKGKARPKPAAGHLSVVWEDGSGDYAPRETREGTVTKPSAPPGSFPYPPPVPGWLDVVKTVACPPPVVEPPVVEPPSSPSRPEAGDESAGKQPEVKPAPAKDDRTAKVLFAVGGVVVVAGAVAWALHRRSVTAGRLEDLRLGAAWDFGYARAQQEARDAEEARAAAEKWAKTQVSA